VQLDTSAVEDDLDLDLPGLSILKLSSLHLIWGDMLLGGGEGEENRRSIETRRKSERIKERKISAVSQSEHFYEPGDVTGFGAGVCISKEFQ
jgi:hypothetical protein